jgi:uncharacterized protein (DUF4415 family)
MKGMDMDQTVEKRKVGRPSSRKKLLTLRLEDEVVDYFRAMGGKGWLQGVNDTLKNAMKQRQRRAEKRASAGRESAKL